MKWTSSKKRCATQSRSTSAPVWCMVIHRLSTTHASIDPIHKPPLTATLATRHLPPRPVRALRRWPVAGQRRPALARRWVDSRWRGGGPRRALHAAALPRLGRQRPYRRPESSPPSHAACVALPAHTMLCHSSTGRLFPHPLTPGRWAVQQGQQQQSGIVPLYTIRLSYRFTGKLAYWYNVIMFYQHNPALQRCTQRPT